tara:strand:- start:1597 stop:1869 length:273 start_codon:yes stop_codon:yes gene_type:complete
MKISYNNPNWWVANADDLTAWFDPKTFDWDYSEMLAKYGHKEFELWWDADMFEWYYNNYLVKYCLAYIDIWYDSSKFSKSYDELLIESIE